MLIEFQQGIYKQQDTRPFLTLTDKGVRINVDDSPTIITFAHGKSNYLFTEDFSTDPAWVGPFPRRKNSWLYWDINLTTGERTFGYTNVDPFANKGFGSKLPAGPARGQHFFLINENKMKYFTGKSWKTVIRVFAGLVKDNGQLIIYENGSQVGRNIQAHAGHILFNEDGVPIKKSGKFGSSEFATVETEFKPQDDLGNTYKIANIQVNARAIEPVPKYHCVNFKGTKQYGLASNIDPDRPCVGVAVEDFVKDKVGKIVTHGVLQNQDFWNFSEPYGTSIWVGSKGEITSIVPQNISLQKIGYVINPTTVFIDIRHVIKMIKYDEDCLIPSPTPTATITPTPTTTVTPTITPTQSPVVSPTSTLTPTPTITPTMTVTPTMSVTPSGFEPILLTYHEWKMTDDFGSIVYDTGTALDKVDSLEYYTSSVKPLKEVRTFVQDDINASAASYIMLGEKGVALENPVYRVGYEYGYSFWIHPKLEYDQGNYYRDVIGDLIFFCPFYNSITYHTYQTPANSVPLEQWTHCFASIEAKEFPISPVGISIADGGAGYQIGDIIYVTDGAITPTTITVTNVDGNGGITTYDYSSLIYGEYSQFPTRYPANAGGGSGNGAKITLSFYTIVKMYINGQLVFESDEPKSHPSTVFAFGFPDTNDTFFGNLCHVRFYHMYTLTASEIQDLYNSYTPVYRPIDYYDVTKIFPDYPIRRSGARYDHRPLHGDYIKAAYLAPDDQTFIFLNGKGEIHSAFMDTPSDITTMRSSTNTVSGNPINRHTWLDSNSTSTFSTFRYGYTFSSDGTKLYYIDSLKFEDINTLVEMSCSTPWDVNTATPTNNTIRLVDSLIPQSIRTNELGGTSYITVQKLRFNSDGTKLFVLDSGNSRLIQYIFQTPYDIKTLRYDQISGPLAGSSIVDFKFSSDGTKFWALNGDTSNIQEYTCPVAWDIENSFFDADIFTANPIDPSDVDTVLFSSDGLYVYVGDDYRDDIHQYQCNSPYNIKNSTYIGKIDITTGCDGFRFRPDGTKVFTLSGNSDTINQWGLSVPWDITTATYDGIAFSITNEIPFGHSDIEFSADGTKMYASDTSKIYQYTLSTPWDISTTSYDNKFGTPSPWESYIKSFRISSDGLKFYLTGRTIDHLMEYNLSVPFDITTLYLHNNWTDFNDYRIFSMNSMEYSPSGDTLYVLNSTMGVLAYDLNTPWDVSTCTIRSQTFTDSLPYGYKVVFNNDGTMMYGIYEENKIVQWLCSAPYDIRGGTVTKVSELDISGTTTYAQRMYIKPDGTGFYFTEDSGDTAISYIMSTPWDITTATYANTFVLTGQTNNPRDITFKPDGTIMYIYDNFSDFVYQYTLSIPWDISTSVYASLSFGTGPGDAIHLKEDGTKLYVTNTTTLKQYTLSSPWDISTASADVDTMDLSQAGITTSNGIYIEPTGNYAFIAYGSGDSLVWRFDMSTPFDITTGTHIPHRANVATLTGQSASGFYSLTFKPDGSRMYIANYSLKYIYQFSLSTPWDINTASYLSREYVNAQDTNPRAALLNDTGDKMYVMGSTNDRLYQYTLSAPWDVTTSTYDAVYLDLSAVDASITSGVYFTSDGTKFYCGGTVTDSIHRFTLSVPWDLTTAIKDMEFSTYADMRGYGTIPRFKYDGTVMYIGGFTKQLVQYTLSTPWDITTSSLGDNKFNLGVYDAQIEGIDYSPNGLNFLIVGSNSGSVFQFKTGIAWDLNSLTFNSKSTDISATSLPSSVGFDIADNGSSLYVGTSSTIQQYAISPAWDIFGVSYIDTSSTQNIIFTDFCGVSSAKDKIYVMYDDETTNWSENRLGVLLEGKMGTPGDITTTSIIKGYYTITEDSIPMCVKFSYDGSKMYMLGASTDSIYQYSLSNPWDLKTITYDSISVSVNAQTSLPTELYFRSDGAKMYCVGGDFIFQYTLGTPWDLSTLVYDNKSWSTLISGEYTTSDPIKVSFSPTGDKMFVMKGTNQTHGYGAPYYQYALGTPWEVDTAVIDAPEMYNHYYASPEAWNSSGTKLYGPALSGGWQIWEFDVLTPWSLSGEEMRGETFPADWEEVCVSPDGNAVGGFFSFNSYSTFRVMKKVGGIWSTYSQFDPGPGWNISWSLMTNSAQYLFLYQSLRNNFNGLDDIIHVFEDQLDGTYLEIDNWEIPPWNPEAFIHITNFSCSDDGSVLLAGDNIYRKNGSVWLPDGRLDVEDIVAFYNMHEPHSFIVPDGSRIIQTTGWYNLHDDPSIQSPIVWKYNTGSLIWEREGILDLSHPDLKNTVIYDELGYWKTSNESYIGSYNDVSFIGSSSDGSIIALNYTSRQTIRDATSPYESSGALVFKETTPGNWEFFQRLRISHPTTTVDSAEYDHSFVSVSRDGNRILVCYIYNYFTQKGAHGKIDIFDFSSETGEYEFIDYIEPHESTYSDLFAVNMQLPGDGSKIFAMANSGMMEDDLPTWDEINNYGFNVDINMFYEFNVGLPGSKPVYQYKAPRFQGWKTDDSLPYKPSIDLIQPYLHYYTGNGFLGLNRQLCKQQSLRDLITNPHEHLTSMVGYNSGKYYVEFFANRDKTTFSNIIINGSFDADSDDWTKGNGWSITGGEAICDGSQTGGSLLTSTISSSTDIRIYKLVYTITSISAGNITPKFGAKYGTTRSSAGTYSEFIKASPGDFSFEANVDFVGSIDNVSLIEVPGFRVGVAFRDYTLPNSELIDYSTTDYGDSEYHYMYDARGMLISNGVVTPVADSPATCVIGIAIDIDNRGVWFSINNTWMQGDPATNTDPMFILPDVSMLDMSDHLYVCSGVYTGCGIGPRQTRTIFRTNEAEFEYSPPSGFVGWDTRVYNEEYDYPYLVKYDNPDHYWRMDSDSTVIDQIGSNDLICSGVSPPTHTLEYGFHKVGSLNLLEDNGRLELSTPIVKLYSEPFTLGAMVYLVPDPDNFNRTHTIFSSKIGDGEDEFELWASGDGSGTDVTFGLSSYHAAADSFISYNAGTHPGTDHSMGYNRWFQITLMCPGDGSISLYVDGVDEDRGKYTTSGAYSTFYFAAYYEGQLIDRADFRLNYLGTNEFDTSLHGYMTEVFFHNKALNGYYGRLFQISTTHVNIDQYYQIIHLAQMGGFNHSDSFNAFPYSWGGPDLEDVCATTMLYKTPFDPRNITSNIDTLTITDYDSFVTPIKTIVISDYDTLTITDYDSMVGPIVSDIYGPYAFEAATTGSVLEFLWTDPTITNDPDPPGGNRHWAWDSNDTPSTGVGPTSGQGGSPEGYVYTEASSSTFGDEFYMEFNTTIDATLYNTLKIEFYTNQRGNDNDATCQVQLNEGGAGWLDVGPLFGGPSDPDKVATSGTQIWSYRNVDLSSANNVNTRIRIKIKFPASGTTFHNDYGIDTVTITGETPR